MIRRREFIAGLGSAAAWPVVTRAQQTDRMRRIGVLMPVAQDDAYFRAGLMVFAQALSELGWTDSRNLRIDTRWAEGNVDLARIFAKELVELQPDVIYAITGTMAAALQRETRAIPIVSVVAEVADPGGGGLVAGLAHPGGNITGFITVEASLGGKWLELLTEIAPAVKRAAIMFGPAVVRGGFLPAFEAAASSLKVTPITALVQSDTAIETMITSLGREPAGGLVVIQGAFTAAHRASIILLAARNKVPAVYIDTTWAREGGLLAYGPDRLDIIRRAAAYVDRIRRGRSRAISQCSSRQNSRWL
jgi:putative ABC transport system substrate-binding protein